MRVALIGDNCIEYVEQLISLWNRGDCVILIDWRLPLKKIIEIIQSNSVCSCYVIDSLVVDKKIIECIKGYKVDCVIIERRLVGEIIPKDVRLKYKENYSRTEAVILYSSGTTGEAKGVILSHFAISTNADSIQQYMNLKENDVMYIMKSLTHSSTLVGELLVGLKNKVKIIVKSAMSNIRNIFFDINKYQITIICVNPTILKLLVDSYEMFQYQIINTLKVIYCSGAVLENYIIEKAKIYFNCSILNVYGLTEAGPRVTAQRGINDSKGSVGKPIQGVQIIIVDHNGVVQKPFKRGIVHVKTVTCFNGYVNNKKGKISLYDNWLNTGDIGYVNNKEELFIVGREDNMLIHQSHNIYPESIESLIKSLGAVEDCMLGEDERGKLVCYYKTKSGRSLDHAQLKHIHYACKKELATFEMPLHYQWVKDFLYTNSGKLIRK
ncbi:MAG: acyl--CoA ligase [Lachnospiraceae bacterium]|nr:acyl--CoA ligase [Lachnospiraceae bacterium]